MQPNQPRRIATLSHTYAATLVLQVGSRFLSDRDQGTVEAIYAAVSSQAAWHAVYSLSVTAAAVLLVAVVANWNRWQATRPTLLGQISFWIVLAAGTCWLVSGLTAMLQTLAAPAIMVGDLGSLSPAGLEEIRAVFGKLGMSMGGAAILLIGVGTRLAGPAGIVMVLTAAVSGVAALGVWWESLPYHRLLGTVYLSWFVASGLILPLYGRSDPNPAA